MLEIDCRKCGNLDAENDRCKLYGNDPGAAVQRCADTGFSGYSPTARLIDADALIRKLRPTASRLAEVYGSLGGAVSGVAKIIDTEPTVEARPVVHGRWVHETTEDDDWGGTYHTWSCSICKFSVGRNPTGENYCPACGAKMDGGAENGR